MKKYTAFLLVLLLLLAGCSEEAPEGTKALPMSGMTLTSVEFHLQTSLDEEIKLAADGTTATHTDQGMFPYGLTVSMADTLNVYRIEFTDYDVDPEILTGEGKLSETMRKEATDLTQADVQSLQPVMQLISLMDLVEVDTSTIKVDDLSSAIANKKAYTSGNWKVWMELDGTTCKVIAEYS